MKQSTQQAIDAALVDARAKNPKSKNIIIAICRWSGGLAWAMSKGTKDQIRIRAAVLAALCIRIFEEGDHTFADIRADNGPEPYTPPYPDD